MHPIAAKGLITQWFSPGYAPHISGTISHGWLISFPSYGYIIYNHNPLNTSGLAPCIFDPLRLILKNDDVPMPWNPYETAFMAIPKYVVFSCFFFTILLTMAHVRFTCWPEQSSKKLAPITNSCFPKDFDWFWPSSTVSSFIRRAAHWINGYLNHQEKSRPATAFQLKPKTQKSGLRKPRSWGLNQPQTWTQQ